MGRDNLFYNLGGQPNPYGQYLVPGRDWEIESPPKPISFYGWCRGVSRFGLIFSGSLSLTLLSRLVPAFIPGYLVLLGIGAAVCVVYASLGRQTGQRITALLILAIALVGAFAGWWDAIYFVLSDRTGQKLAIQIAIVACALLGTALFWNLLAGGRDR